MHRRILAKEELGSNLVSFTAIKKIEVKFSFMEFFRIILESTKNCQNVMIISVNNSNHAQETGHPIHYSDFSILSSATPSDLLILESLYILKHKPNLNHNQVASPLLITTQFLLFPVRYCMITASVSTLLILLLRNISHFTFQFPQHISVSNNCLFAPLSH